MVLVFISAEGKKVVRKAIAVTPVLSGDNAITIQFDELEHVERLIQLNLDVTAAMGANRGPTPYGVAYSGNTAGLTVNIGVGNTLQGEAIASGY